MTSHTIDMPQPQAPADNHPFGQLLAPERREDYIDTAVPLYIAVIQGNLKATKLILEDPVHVDLVRHSISEKKETPLHLAVMGYRRKLVKYLVGKMSEDDLKLRNKDGNTAFCLAAIAGDVGIAKIMLKKNADLSTVVGSGGMMPLYLAALHGNRNMVTFLYDKSGKMLGTDWTDGSRHGVLLKCIQTGIFDVALRILEDNEQLPHDDHVGDMLQVLARKRWAFQVRRVFPFSKEGNGTLFLRLLWGRIVKRPKIFIDTVLKGPKTVVQISPGHSKDTYPSQVLFIAAKMNNPKFLVELISKCPDLIWVKNDDDGRTIFHVAVAHRHHDIFNLLYEMRSMKDLMTPITDNEGNNILHLVGKNPENNEYKKAAAPTFQMFSEYFWYKKVERMLPPIYRYVENTARQKPQQLFEENQKKLTLEGMKSMNKSISVSMVVAALVCTIAFSVIYSVPGGFRQNDGFPIFLHNQYFIYFVVSDVASFICSTTSIIFFLSLIHSGDHVNMLSVHTRWLYGHLSLFYSVFFLLLAFSSALTSLYKKTVWTTIFYVVSLLLLALYAIVCLTLVTDMQRLLTVTGKRHRLYRKN